jgi:carboxyl-terminal processing protease
MSILRGRVVRAICGLWAVLLPLPLVPLTSGCGRLESSTPAVTAASGTATAAASVPAVTTEKAADAKPSAAPFTDGEKVLLEVKRTLQNKYYKAGFTDDELARAAVAGMLQQLEPQMASWNKLLPPEEMRELGADLKGEIVGIGVEIRFDKDSGISDVLGVIPGSPAERAGLREGDKILAVGSKQYKGQSLRDVVSDLRGLPGASVQLTVLSGVTVRTLTLQRARVAYDLVHALVLPGQVGYLQVRLFSENTDTQVRTALSELLQKKVQGLVIDVRGNQGGLFDKAVATAELLLPKDAPVVKVVRRQQAVQVLKAQQAGPGSGLPMAVLCDTETASGAELLAGALREGAGALLLGQKTFGKGSIQELEELPNHYGIKYTAAVFSLPSGVPIEGVGLSPDIEVNLALPEAATYERQLSRVQRLSDGAQRLQQDAPLRAAVQLLRARKPL